jgi:hypothetical protein
MGYIQGEGRGQGSLFPVVLDDLVPVDHMCRVIDAFVARLALSELGFERAQAAETGRPGYDPRDLLKLYLYIAGELKASAIPRTNAASSTEDLTCFEDASFWTRPQGQPQQFSALNPLTDKRWTV